MAVINHKTNKMISNIKKEDLIGFFTEAMLSVDKLLSLRDAFTGYEDGSVDDDDLYNVVCDSQLDLFYTKIYQVSACAWLPSINRYTATLCECIRVFNEKIVFFQKNYLFLTDADIATFRNYSYEILSGLLFIIYYDFGLCDIVDGSKDIDEIYNNYCLTYSEDPISYAGNISNLVKTYKFKLQIFDEYPEYEDAFDNIVGPFRLEIDEEKLTINHVISLINGDTTIQDLIKEIPSSSAETEFADAMGMSYFN